MERARRLTSSEQAAMNCFLERQAERAIQPEPETAHYLAGIGRINQVDWIGKSNLLPRGPDGYAFGVEAMSSLSPDKAGPKIGSSTLPVYTT